MAELDQWNRAWQKVLIVSKYEGLVCVALLFEVWNKELAAFRFYSC